MSRQIYNPPYFDAGLWRFIIPQEGCSLFVVARGGFRHYRNGAWGGAGALATLVDAPSISWDMIVQPIAQVTLAGNRTLANPPALPAGAVVQLLVRQDATGGRSLSFGNAYAFAGGNAPTLTSVGGRVDLLRFICDGSKLLGECVNDIR